LVQADELESAWDKVSLEEVDDMADLKEAIKKKVPHQLDNYNTNQLTVKATKMIEDVNQAREQDAQQDLVSVLKDCDVIVPDGVPSVQKFFAENIQLFVFAPGKLHCLSHISLTFQTYLLIFYKCLLVIAMGLTF